MSDSETHSNCIVQWFRNLIRPIFQKTEPVPVLEELDKLANHVEAISRSSGTFFPICLLGQGDMAGSCGWRVKAGVSLG